MKTFNIHWQNCFFKEGVYTTQALSAEIAEDTFGKVFGPDYAIICTVEKGNPKKAVNKVATTAGNITFTATKRFVQVRCKGQTTFKVTVAGSKFTSSIGDITVSSQTAEGCYKKAIRAFWSY